MAPRASLRLGRAARFSYRAEGRRSFGFGFFAIASLLAVGIDGIEYKDLAGRSAPPGEPFSAKNVVTNARNFAE